MDGSRYTLDELRRLAAALGEAAGLAPARAAALATHLTWYDALGLAEHGVGSLPGWLERLADGRLDPKAAEAIGPERPATAILEAARVPGPLALARAADLAAEKAREVGVGVVRVAGLSWSGPSASALASAAVGPFAALALGPAPSWAIALPAFGGPPAVLDSALDTGPKEKDRKAAKRPDWAGLLGPWSGVLAPEGEWLVAALSVQALGTAEGFADRVAALAGPADAVDRGLILPGPAEARRREARERGVEPAPEVRAALGRWAERLGVDLPGPRPA